MAKNSSKPPKLHRSFKRSYREDYQRDIEIPGLLHFACTTMGQIFKNWRLFLPLFLIIVFANIILVGLMSEDTYAHFQELISPKISAEAKLSQVSKAGFLLVSTIATGGLAQGLSESQLIFLILIFLITWLVTIYIVRQRAAGHKIKLRDALYNALTPFISTMVVFFILLLQLLPVLLAFLVYSIAIQTNFLANPFYALVFFIFATVMGVFSLYFFSSSFFGLIAVTVPGMYPLAALRIAKTLVISRRIKVLLRLAFLVVITMFSWVVVMLPLILLDLWLKGIFSWLSGVPFIPIVLLSLVCFTMIYFAAYSYLFYRQVFDYEKI